MVDRAASNRGQLDTFGELVEQVSPPILYLPHPLGNRTTLMLSQNYGVEQGGRKVLEFTDRRNTLLYLASCTKKKFKAKS